MFFWIRRLCTSPRAASESELSEKAKKILLDPENVRLVSSASILEIAIKSAKGLLAMTREQTIQAVADLRLTIIPFQACHAYRMFDLKLHHKDPFDRMLIATALSEDVPLMSGDLAFKSYKGLLTIW